MPPTTPGTSGSGDTSRRTFTLHRDTDVSGVSGTGVVVEGCRFSDGSVVMRWLSSDSSTVIWSDLDKALRVHGHDGATRLVWDTVCDDHILHEDWVTIGLNELAKSLHHAMRDRVYLYGVRRRMAEAHEQGQASGGLVSGACVECGNPWPCPSYVWATTDRNLLAPWNPADDDEERISDGC